MGRIMMDISWAYSKSHELLKKLEDRWNHTKGVAEKAKKVSNLLKEDEKKILLISSSYLHDIGYSSEISKTGLHQLDGANYLIRKKQIRLASIVAFHSESIYEANLRNLHLDFEKFNKKDIDLIDILTYCDMTTSSKGKDISFKERIDEILLRYSSDHIVSKTINLALPKLKLTIDKIENMIYNI